MAGATVARVDMTGIAAMDQGQGAPQPVGIFAGAGELAALVGVEDLRLAEGITGITVTGITVTVHLIPKELR